ncbi:MAG: carbamoyltransferase HypF [Candidatus Thermoplasmatota archaeon]|nr:carbamoyltransferase HypF [Candidatus Thermoplasmatota archaeon]
MRAVIRVSGIVQGVGFRPFIYRLATARGLDGYVLNRGDAGVEIVVEGPRDSIDGFLEAMHGESPPLASIETTDIAWENRERHDGFEIQRSSRERGKGASIIPPDVSICQDCIDEMRDPGDRRHQYFFTTCTNCGPRYTTITGLPYDRPQTTMDAFPMCETCHAEYTDPGDRRYHAQTIACPDCGPQVYLRDEHGKALQEGAEAIQRAGRLLVQGSIIAVRGNGGFHLACNAAMPDVVRRLRTALGRPRKPFAVMAANLDMAREIAHVDEQERQLLTSPVRPIMLLSKKRELSGVSPGLHTVGVMLPYTGLHVMLLEGCSTALVMTSANMPGEPIVYQNREALHKLAGIADVFLTYDREIAHRCDDSVARVVNGEVALIRRSRGYVPAPVPAAATSHDVLALGPELDVTSCVLSGGKAFLSPYIGDVSRLATQRFLEEETEHLLGLTDATPEAVAHDLHPRFASTEMAKRYAADMDVPAVAVQHHHAHVAKVMAEHDVGEAIGIAVDGIGYGSDGSMWGGEILHCTRGGFTRVGHLEVQPMIGGDLATRYPLRMLAGILGEADGLETFLLERADMFPHGEREVDIVLRQAAGGQGVPTSSCGRVLDATAALLDVCHRRHYEGEPAMLLESHARDGIALDIAPEISWAAPAVLHTSPLFRWLWQHRDKDGHDLASTAEAYLARGLADIAASYAQQEHIDVVALAGGCAYNGHLSHVVATRIEQAGLRCIRNRMVPAGDGGISYGQAVVADARLD